MNLYRFPAVYDAYMKLLGRGFLLDFRSCMSTLVAEKKNQRLVVLEVGCGTGNNCIELAKMLPNSLIIGLDPNRKMLLHAQKKINRGNFKNIDLINGQLTDALPALVNLKLDYIICVLGLSVIEDWLSVLDISNVLLDNRGRLVIVDAEINSSGLQASSISLFLKLLFNANHKRHIQIALESRFHNCTQLTYSRGIYLSSFTLVADNECSSPSA